MLAPVFKLWFRSSEPFAGVCDLGALGAAAPANRRDPPALLSLLLSAAVVATGSVSKMTLLMAHELQQSAHQLLHLGCRSLEVDVRVVHETAG